MLKAKVFQPPNGDVTEIEVRTIAPEHAAFFNQHGYEISLENLSTGDVAVYAQDPNLGDEHEICVIDFGDGPHETFRKLVDACEAQRQGAAA